MDHFDENEIGRLLRLKRHEQPPPGYFENFLHEFHRRQRAELLRQPLWRIALQRAHDSLLQLNLSSLTSYPAAAAAVLICAAVLSLNVLRTPTDTGGVTVTSREQVPAVAVADNEDASWSLSRPVSTRSLDAATFRMPYPTAPTRGRAVTPRYVLDSTPVSYEPALRF